MDEQIIQEIVSEITSVAIKTIESTDKKSLEKALQQEFLNRTTCVALKRLKSSSNLEFKVKVHKICFKAKTKW